LLLAGIRRLDPDIIAIQEANPLPQYAKRLAADLGYQIIYHVSLGGIRLGPFGIPTNLREGEAILVKKPWTITDLGVKRLGGWGIATNLFCFHFGEITQALLSKVIINGELFYIYAVHLHSGPFQGHALNEIISNLSRGMPTNKVEEANQGVLKDIERRKLEIVNLMKFIEDTLPAGVPAILLGDFNTTAESNELEPLFQKMWVDSYRLMNPDKEGFTWDPLHNPNFRAMKASLKPYDVLRVNHERYQHRIDFIMVSNNIRNRIIKSDVVLTPSDGFPASDHYGVLTTLR
jgi:endonuclease/exonuclease/phosphatase family metal-dependent hydrolase